LSFFKPAIISNLKRFVLHQGDYKCYQRKQFLQKQNSFLVVNDKHNYDPLHFFNTRVTTFGYFSDKNNQDIVEYEQDIYNDLSSNNANIKIRCTKYKLDVNKNSRVLIMTTTVRKM
jgi:hypothetical protein